MRRSEARRRGGRRGVCPSEIWVSSNLRLLVVSAACSHLSSQPNMPPKRLADIAAPAPQAAPVETVVVKKESAKQKARIDKGLAEVRVERIRVDGLVSPPRLIWGAEALGERVAGPRVIGGER